MPARIVLFGATGFTGKLTAKALVRRGARPVLAGRNRDALTELATQLGGLDIAVADSGAPDSVRRLADRDDVLVSTVGPFTVHGTPAVEAAVATGARYLDSTGEPPFVARVFREWGPQAARSGALLLTGFGYDYVPGHLAAALALTEAGVRAERVDVGYFATGKARPSTGTLSSLSLVAVEPAYVFRDGHVVLERPARSVRTFLVRGRRRQAISIGGTEHFALPRSFPSLREVNVYLGWFGAASRGVQVGSALTAAVPGGRRAAAALLRRMPKPAPGAGPDAERRRRSTSYVVAAAYDRTGDQIAEVHLSGIDPYDFTAEILAWGAVAAAAGDVEGVGAQGPVEAYGLDRLRAGAETAGLRIFVP